MPHTCCAVFSGLPDAADSAAFASVTANVHDVQFSPDGSLLFARTYMSAMVRECALFVLSLVCVMRFIVQVWDVRMEKPLHSIPVQPITNCAS